MEITNFSQALDYIYSTIPQNNSLKFPGALGLKRQAALLKFLDNPQNKYPIIHIAGTSGKGSTATYLSHLLSNHYFKVGLTISPHLIDIRERIQFNNRLISKNKFVFYLNEIIPAVEKVKKTSLGNPTYFEILIALAFYSFYKEGVNYAVVETGMGGLYDGTNVIKSSNKLVVITRLGLDHTEILGKKMIDIAAQKAGIIQDNNLVLSLNSNFSVRQVLDKVAQKHHTQINYLSPKSFNRNINKKITKLSYDYQFLGLDIKNISLNTFALYQIENSALALSALNMLSHRDHFPLKIHTIKTTIAKVIFSGRMEIFKISNKNIILDGAHNPQKMTSFIKSLSNVFPQQKFTFVLAFKHKKDFSSMLKLILPFADFIFITNFSTNGQDMHQISEVTDNIVYCLKQFKFSKYLVVKDPNQALKKAIKKPSPIIITGSLYLLSQIYCSVKKLSANFQI